MTATACIVHGYCERDEYFSDDYPSPSNFHWIPWLQKKMLQAGYDCQTPDFPAPYAPDYRAWDNLLSRFAINEDTVLIGHSYGGGFLLKYLALNASSIRRLVLVAPDIDPRGIRGDFLNFDLPDALPSDTHLLISDDEDDADVLETVKIIMERYPVVTIHRFSGYGHFIISAMGTDRFPELFDIAV